MITRRSLFALGALPFAPKVESPREEAPKTQTIILQIDNKEIARQVIELMPSVIRRQGLL